MLVAESLAIPAAVSSNHDWIQITISNLSCDWILRRSLRNKRRRVVSTASRTPFRWHWKMSTTATTALLGKATSTRLVCSSSQLDVTEYIDRNRNNMQKAGVLHTRD